MGRKVTLASATLNQWALDFEGNLNRILQSVLKAKYEGAFFRTGPELEICGYSCEDHFYESDTFLHSWEVLAELLTAPLCKDILIDVGMPVMHKNVAYNCRVILFNQKILLIRPKMVLCDDGGYRESRWFTSWKKVKQIEDFYLPRMISAITEQRTVPIGDAVIATIDTCIGFEICEELWCSENTHVSLAKDGVEIICNSSGSYTQLRKNHILDDLVKSATTRCGGCYIFSNLRGCDGQRFYFQGTSSITVNGKMLARTKQFSMKEYEVITATVDLEDIRTYRNSKRAHTVVASSSTPYPRINLDFSLSPENDKVLASGIPLEIQYLTPEEEIAQGAACWLWDYLRRSGQGGFFLPLSGGLDSSSSALIVYSMCHMIIETLQEEEEDLILADLRRVIGKADYYPVSAKELCGKLLVTSYMGTENSSPETNQRALKLSKAINSYHLTVFIDTAVNAVVKIFNLATNFMPKFAANGGSIRENLALQNVQARLRMVLSYLFAQLMQWVREGPGGLLVLGSANVDEALRGYMTKYDCSSADINPIGCISKTDLRKFMVYAKDKFNIPVIDEILAAPPTAELEPLVHGQTAQTDEEDMGMTYEELSHYGRLRKIENCGPFSMYCKLVHIWADTCTPQQVADKVKHFFRCYAINRHKMTVLTPSYHAECYSPDDNRFDLRPFLYKISWSWQFSAIDKQKEHFMKISKTISSKSSGSTKLRIGVTV